MHRVTQPCRLSVTLTLIGCVAGAFAVPSRAAGPFFVDVTAPAGLTHTQGPPSDPQTTPEVIGMTGGAAAGDFDGDGWVDLFVTRSDNTDILYRNMGDGTFTDVSASAFGSQPINAQTNGAAFGDIDNDGDLDLYVTAVLSGRHFLYINQGDGTFSEQAAARNAGLGGNGTLYGTGVAFGDYDRDGYLDAYIADWRPTSPGTRANARLLRNQGAANPGHFTDVTHSVGAAMDDPAGLNRGVSWSFAPRFSDIDQDGHTDILVASDFGTSRIFWNNGDNTFVNGTDAAGIDSGWHDMGSALGDADNDGDFDWFTTDIYFDGLPDSHPNGNRLFLNNNDRSFTDHTSQAGVRSGGWGWGAAFLDYDNDGDLDIAHTNGFIDGDDYLNDPMRLFNNDGNAQFTEVAAATGATDTGQGRGLLYLDYDNDGDLDLFIARNGQTPVLYRNDGGDENDYLRIKTIGTRSNRQGIGAVITLTPDPTKPDEFIVLEVDGGSHFLSQSPATAHFGLGPDAGEIGLLTIRWPSGIVQTLTGVAPNTTHTVVETALPGDLNGDGFIGIDDLNTVLSGWNQTVSPGEVAAGDITGDGFVGIQDLNAVLSAWNTGTPPPPGGVTVPEPTTALLLSGGLVLLIRRGAK